MIAPPNLLARVPHIRREWSELLRDLGIRPSRALGQHFLIEHGIVDKIVRTAGTSHGDIVVEIGPGLGILTAHLLDAGARVIAIELDRDLAPYLFRTFGDLPSFVLVEGNALHVRIDEVVSPRDRYSVVANLPYAVASAIIMRFLELPDPPRQMTVMVQREVAERFVAQPPQMSVPGVAAQLLAEPAIAFTVAPGSFLPPPNVESAVVVLRPLGDARLPATQRPSFFTLLNAGFRHKRKQLLNSLAFELDLEKDDIANRLIAAGIDPMRRAQTLSVDDWLAVHRVWARLG